MIVKSLTDVIGTADHASGDGWQSRRLLLAREGLGYSLHDTVVSEGQTLELEYKNHVETNYCIAGEGTVTNVLTGEVFPLSAGTVYVLDNHEPHILTATKGDLRLVCVFTPALSGTETHDASGSYAASE
ncbi:ectoine synthase [Amylibacter sp. IMCC11727]|uniref:ectoine synthase n=1 Tax=Amylibacter sp. IMCC11727 TaxID=3039851 RepID=UPI00244E0854|nr:ectoine synthase [Amylibacter sp. IMCC11727]WGI20326.1 ectoine synthase [Amylibacter sp. IMCC11727]